MLLLMAMVLTPACGQCHAKEVESFTKTPMARALRKGSGEIPDSSFKDGQFSISVRKDRGQNIYTATDGQRSVTAPLLWEFGDGLMGRTFLFRQGNDYYETTVSFYSAIRDLDLTPGHRDRPRRNLEEAAGRKVDPAELRRCFGCHAAFSTLNDMDQSAELGVQCGHCHSGAAEHASALVARKTPAVMQKLSRLSSEETSQLCGKCHRTWEDIAANGPHTVLNVRFQPYRLAESKCYDVADRRIACTACHDPHAETRHDIGFYDAKCEACHNTAAKQVRTCPVAKSNCVSCHMPKVEIPGLHHEFSDHRIRIARTGEPYR
jgi:hypothetical protein